MARVAVTGTPAPDEFCTLTVLVTPGVMKEVCALYSRVKASGQEPQGAVG